MVDKSTGGSAESSPGLDKMLEVVADSPKVEPGHAFLLIVSGSEPGRLHMLDKAELVIGRSKYADIRISERALSQQHAKLVQEGDHHRIYDLGSTNGTFVNDQPIKDALLKVGDVIQTGETVFTYMSSAQPTAGESSSEATMALASLKGRSATAMNSGGLSLPPRLPLQRVASPQTLAGPVGPDDGETDLLGMILLGLDFLRRYGISIALFTLLGTAAGVASYRYYKPPAKAEFVIELLAKPSDNPVDNLRRQHLEFFRTAPQSFVRPALIRNTLEELGASEDENPNAIGRELALNQGHRIRTMYTGAFEHANAEFAREFLDTHLRLFIDSEINRTLEVLQVEVKTLEEKLADTESQLNATEQAILAFKEEHSEGLPEQAQQYYQDLIELGSERQRTLTELSLHTATLKNQQNRLKSESRYVSERIEQSRPYEDEIAEVNKALVAAQASGKGPQHPDVVALKTKRQQYERLRNKVLKEGTGRNLSRDSNPLYEDIRHAVDDADANRRVAMEHLSRLTNDLERTKKIVTELPRLQQEYAELTRSYETTKSIHNNLFEKLTSSRLQLDMERASVKARYDIITPPHVISQSAMKTMIMRGGMLGVLGLMCAIGLGLLRDLRRMLVARRAAMQS